ncbi:MAG: hypothetical protein WBL49_08080 [Nitrososphaeraceae archaeon]
MSLVITLCLLTIFIILSLDIGTVNLEDKFFETASAQVFNNTGSVIQNKTAESTIPADRSYLANVIISAGTGLPQSIIAVPLYSSASDNNGNRNNTNNMTFRYMVWWIKSDRIQ